MHCVVPFLLSCILRDVSFTEVGSVCRVALREPMHLYTCVSKEGGNGEAPSPETPSLLSYTLCTRLEGELKKEKKQKNSRFGSTHGQEGQEGQEGRKTQENPK